MLGLGVISSLLGSSNSQTKEEKKEIELREAEKREQRAFEERQLDSKRRAFETEGGTATPDAKDSKPKVRQLCIPHANVYLELHRG
jgi:hypothetical protein